MVIDVQNEYVTGKLRITYPDIGTSLKNVACAMDTAHKQGIPIVTVQQVAPAGAPIFAPGSDGMALHPEVASRPCDYLIAKALPSAFEGTALLSWLRQHGVDTLTVTGYMTHNCVASTVIQALHHGFAVEVLDDATGSLPYANSAGTASGEEIHRVYMTVFQSRFAAVASTADWCGALADGSVLARSTIVQSNGAAVANAT